MSVTTLDDRRQPAMDRVPPRNLEAEMALIGAMIIDPEIAAVTETLLEPDDFYAHVHESIFAAMVALRRRGQPHDLVALAEELKRNKRLETCGGISYLQSLLDTVQTVSSASYYAQIVREKSTLRKLIATGYDIVRLGFEGEVDVRETLATCEQRLRTVTERNLHGDAGTTLERAMVTTFNELGSEKGGGLKMPWPEVNRMIGGVYPGNLTAISAGPGVGKTGALLCMADYIAAHHGLTQLYSLEMSRQEIVQRLFAMYGRVPAKVIRGGNLNEWQVDQISNAYDLLKARPLTIFEQSRTASKPWTVNDIRAQLARSPEPVRAVFIDYITCLDEPDARVAGATEHERLDAIYRKLLRIGAEFQTSIFVVHPINRKGMDGEPTLKDLKGGGNAEYHAHNVLFLHRPKIKGTKEDRMIGKIIVGKNRDGEEYYIDALYKGFRHLWLEQSQRQPWFEPSIEQPELDV